VCRARNAGTSTSRWIRLRPSFCRGYSDRVPPDRVADAHGQDDVSLPATDLAFAGCDARGIGPCPGPRAVRTRLCTCRVSSAGSLPGSAAAARQASRLNSVGLRSIAALQRDEVADRVDHQPFLWFGKPRLGGRAGSFRLWRGDRGARWRTGSLSVVEPRCFPALSTTPAAGVRAVVS
jgi:hypothetical protein